jgi:hypothetical protein
MNSFKKLLWSAIIFMLLVAALAMTSIGTSHGQSPGKDVIVTNTTVQPVPTLAQGTTTVAGTVGISGTPTFNLAPGASVGLDPAQNTVQVASSEAAPLLVRNVGGSVAQPVHAEKLVTLDECCNNAQETIFQVPEDKRLVIEYVTALAIVPAGVKTQLNIFTTVNNERVRHFVACIPGGGENSISLPTRLYARPGSDVTIQLVTQGSAGSGVLKGTISGYLEDAPPSAPN